MKFLDLVLNGMENIENMPTWEAAWNDHPSDGGVDAVTYISIGPWLGFKDNLEWHNLKCEYLTLQDIKNSRI